MAGAPAMNYDLPKPPEGYRTDLALIIAPYFDLWFARRIVKQLKPRKIRFIVDDGARDKEVRLLRDDCGAADIKVALGRASGIVHLKGYYLEFIKLRGRSQRKRRFVFGSPNATKAAFSGETNAELIAEVDMSDKENAELFQYLMSILSAVESGGGLIKATRTPPTRNVPMLFCRASRLGQWVPLPALTPGYSEDV
jgi:hypothetical protein